MPVTEEHRVKLQTNLSIATTLLVIPSEDRTERTDHPVTTTELIAVCKEVSVSIDGVGAVWSAADLEGDSFVIIEFPFD